MAVAACGRCGAGLGGWYRPGTLCGHCERELAAERVAREEEWLTPRACLQCEAEFLPRQLNQVFCGARCRLKHWRAEKARAVAGSA
jgi:hypothetical protein